MTTQQHDEETVDERLQNLGLVVTRGRKLDKTLRNAFCSILGNKYAVVLARVRSAERLIKNCRAVLAEHREITGEHRGNILLALDACESANKHRDELLHGTKVAGAAAAADPCASKSSCHQPDSEIDTPAEKILEVAEEIAAADTQLFCAMKNAVSPEVMVIGEALAWEERRGKTACD
jgi:hypothetical protein